MTTTARRAFLTVLAALAVALTASPALAADDSASATPTISAEEQAIIDAQIAAERSGGYRCPDPVDTFPCDEPTPTAATPTTGPVTQPTPAPAPRPAGQESVATGAASAQPAPSTKSDPSAPSTPTAQPPAWALLDRVMQILKALVPWASPAVA